MPHEQIEDSYVSAESTGYSEGAGGLSGCTHEDGNGYCNHPMGVHVDCEDASAMDVDTLDIDVMCLRAL